MRIDRTARREDRLDTLPSLLRLCIEEKIVDADTGARNDKYEPLLLGTAPDPEKRFDTFVPSEQNRRIVDLCMGITDDTTPNTTLYLHGQPGLGKTHLLSATANALSTRSAALVHAADLSFEYERAGRLWQRAELLHWLDHIDLLLIDDVHFLKCDAAAQQALYVIINRFQETGRRIVVSADEPPKALRSIDTRLISRFDAGIVLTLTMPSIEVRSEIIRRMAGAERLTDEVVQYVSTNAKESIRHLKASVVQMLALSAHDDIEVGVDLARAIVPLPEDLGFGELSPETAIDSKDFAGSYRAREFKSMLENAETEEEQVLALQIIISAKLKELRELGRGLSEQAKMERALKYLREGNKKEAIACIG